MDNRPRLKITQDDFEYWLFSFDDALDEFLEGLPNELQDQLDASIDSLLSLERWLLARYADSTELKADSEGRYLEEFAKYVGEVFRRTTSVGVWAIDLEDQKNAYYGIPVIRGAGGDFCPTLIVTASLSRRTGSFIRDIILNRVGMITGQG